MRKWIWFTMMFGIALCGACAGKGPSEEAFEEEMVDTKETGAFDREETGESPERETGLAETEMDGAEERGPDRKAAGQSLAHMESEETEELPMKAQVQNGRPAQRNVPETAQGPEVPKKSEPAVQDAATGQIPAAERTSEPVREPEPTEAAGPAAEPETSKGSEPAGAPESAAIPEADTISEPAKEPEPAVEKSIYDYAFDVPAIRSELIALGQSMGLTHVTEDDGVPCTPDTRSWASPITASQSLQGDRLRGALKDYVASMPSMVASYGGPPVSCFTIYVRENGGGSYTFYFLY